MSAFPNEIFSRKIAPKSLYPLVLSRSDLTGEDAKEQERKFHECIFE